MKLSGRNLLVSGTSSVLLPNAQTCKQGKVSVPDGSGFTSILSYLRTAILYGAINMLHTIVLLLLTTACHLPWYKTQLTCASCIESCMHRSGVALRSMDGIRRSYWESEVALLPFGVTPPLA